MLSLNQIARYNKLAEQCLIHHDRESIIVPLNAMTVESLRCRSLQPVSHVTETYVRWILALPLHINHNDSLTLAKSIAIMCVNNQAQLSAQQRTIKAN